MRRVVDVAESNAKMNDGIMRLVVAMEANLQRQTEAIESIAANSKQLLVNSTRQTLAIESFLSRGSGDAKELDTVTQLTGSEE